MSRTAECNYTRHFYTQANLPKMREGGLVSFLVVHVAQGLQRLAYYGVGAVLTSAPIAGSLRMRCATSGWSHRRWTRRDTLPLVQDSRCQMPDRPVC